MVPAMVIGDGQSTVGRGANMYRRKWKKNVGFRLDQRKFLLVEYREFGYHFALQSPGTEIRWSHERHLGKTRRMPSSECVYSMSTARHAVKVTMGKCWTQQHRSSSRAA